MTDRQKSEILRLRTTGLTFGEIAMETGILRNTVKTICNRASANPPAPAASPAPEIAQQCLCQNCAKPLHSKEKRKPRKFCSDRCRQAWWNAHRNQLHHRAEMDTCVCPGCGAEFLRYKGSQQVYCSHKCYISRRFGHDK